MTPLGRIAYTVLVAFIASLLTLLAIDWLGLAPDSISEAPHIEESPAIRVINMEELARHDQPDDCWMAIHGQVYDFTDYLPRHPTPAHVLPPYCGTDASVGWDTKGVGRPHSPRARDLLPDYRIGVLAADPSD